MISWDGLRYYTLIFPLLFISLMFYERPKSVPFTHLQDCCCAGQPMHVVIVEQTDGLVKRGPYGLF